MSRILNVNIGGRLYEVEVGDLGESPVCAKVDGEMIYVDVELVDDQIDTEQKAGTHINVVDNAKVVPESGVSPVPDVGTDSKSEGKQFSSPMPGIIISVAVAVGDQVITGDEVCILEAMKMQQVLRADWSGIVRTVHVHEGQQVLGGDPIIDLG